LLGILETTLFFRCYWVALDCRAVFTDALRLIEEPIVGAIWSLFLSRDIRHLLPSIRNKNESLAPSFKRRIKVQV
jgi:hypothetical protein